MHIASDKPMWQRFLTFLFPMMIGNVLQSLSGTINTIYVGQLIGVEALAAVAVFFPIMIFLISFMIGLGSGASILVGQAWGAKNTDKVKQIAGTVLTVSFLSGLVVAVLGGLFAESVMTVLGAPENILRIATDYGRVMLFGMPAMFIFMVYTSIMRGVGDTMTPLITLLISIGIGLLVTPALILGWFGLPQIGALAAAVATVMSFVVVLVFLFFFMRARAHPLAPDAVLIRYLRVDVGTLMLVLKLGLPSGLQMVVASSAAIVLIGLINSYGSDATAAYGAVNQVMSYVHFPAMSMGIAASIFAAQAIGAGKTQQIETITRTALMMNVFITGGFVLAAYIFSERLVALFLTDPAVVETSQTLLHIVLWSIVLFGAGSVFSSVMRASGVVMMPMLIAFGSILLVEVPAAFILSGLLGLEGIWWAHALAFCALFVGQAAYYRFVWAKRDVVALV